MLCSSHAGAFLNMGGAIHLAPRLWKDLPLFLPTLMAEGFPGFPIKLAAPLALNEGLEIAKFRLLYIICLSEL